MAIPEAQLETWSHPGAAVGSASTYAAIQRALKASSASYVDRNFDVFLQGSYGNDTNVRGESDVDVVACYRGAFFDNLDMLTPEQRTAYNAQPSTPAVYGYAAFKTDVEKALRAAFGNSVQPGKKAIKIVGDSTRRDADVVVAFNLRRYERFVGSHDYHYDEGICFFPSTGGRIDNFPTYHSENATAKHQATNGNFKPVVRIFKNLRNHLVAHGVLVAGEAPSYFIEGLLYNVPERLFTGSYSQMVFNILKWLLENTNRTQFTTVSGRHYLLRDGLPICWPTANGQRFIQAAANLWDNW